MKKQIIFLLIILLLSCSAPVQDLKININNKEYTVFIAKDDQSRARGLMYVKNIKKDGMLFVYSSDSNMSFWMKNTYIPLSIAYISSSGVIKEIFDMTPLSEESINSTYSVRYALEVTQGFFDKEGIKVGDVVYIPKVDEVK